MKKIDTDKLEKLAKEKNIDKNKIENIAEQYQGKSEDELMDELIVLGQNLQGKEEIVEKFKAFLDDKQRKKLDTIMGKLANAESKKKVEDKKSKGKKSKKEEAEEIEEVSKGKKSKSSKTPKSDKSGSNKKNEAVDSSPKKVKKVKKIKKSELNEED